MTRFYPYGFLAALTLVGAHMPLIGQEMRGNVTIQAVDSRGHVVTGCEVKQFSNISSRVDLVLRFEANKAKQVPFGTYDVVLWRKPLKIEGLGDVLGTGQVCVDHARVEVGRRETFAILRTTGPSTNGAGGDHILPADFVIRGTVQGLPAHRTAAWLRLAPVLPGNRDLDVEIDEQGKFFVYEPLGGTFSAAVLVDGEVVGIQEVVFPGLKNGTELTLAIPKNRSKPSVAK